MSNMSEKRITTESIVNDLRVIAKYPQNVNAPYICRLAAERLEELDDKCAEFAGILPACEGCSGKTVIGERTKDCVYEVDGAYCMDRARKNYFALKARVAELEAEVAKLREANTDFVEKIHEKVCMAMFDNKSEDYANGYGDALEWYDAKVAEALQEVENGW